MLAELRVKVKSLAEEARIIRKEERVAASPATRSSLYRHRTVDVRREQRAALLAYAFLRGRSYAATEGRTAKTAPDLSRLRRLVEKFGGVRSAAASMKPLQEQLADWVAGK